LKYAASPEAPFPLPLPLPLPVGGVSPSIWLGLALQNIRVKNVSVTIATILHKNLYSLEGMHHLLG
jgi:hypothetical protein